LALDIITSPTNLKVIVVVGNPNEECKRAFVTDEMKQIARG
jgi:hypothetical protein